MCTPIDPLFLIIPKLEQSRNNNVNSESKKEGFYCDITQILFDLEYPSFSLLYNNNSELRKEMKKICDVLNEETDSILYRLNDNSLLTWLHCKINYMLLQLPIYKQSINNTIHATASSSSFKTNKQKQISEQDKIKLCINFLSEYLTERIISMLYNSYNIINSSNVSNNYSIDDENIRNKKTKTTTDGKDKTNTKKTTRTTVAQSKLSKTNIKGMNKMESYFTKKN